MLKTRHSCWNHSIVCKNGSFGNSCKKQKIETIISMKEKKKMIFIFVGLFYLIFNELGIIERRPITQKWVISICFRKCKKRIVSCKESNFLIGENNSKNPPILLDAIRLAMEMKMFPYKDCRVCFFLIYKLLRYIKTVREGHWVLVWN